MNMIHALENLVGSRGTTTRVAAVAFGVVLPCFIGFSARQHVISEHFCAWFFVFFGLVLAALASYLLLRGWTGEEGSHAHGSGAAHGHWMPLENRGRRWVEVTSAAVTLVAGLAIAAFAISRVGDAFNVATLTHSRMASFAAIVLLGLFLGVRHSTDADHVVAVSTIVSRERSVRQGAMIGVLWGIGHTVTIFIVGSAIILFRLTIPPRLGLLMEMAVAGMLILLGVLNLTGLLRRLTEKLTPKEWTRAQDDALAPIPAHISLASTMTRNFGYYQILRPLAIGLVHGLAGSAAVALLVLSMIRNPIWAIAYLIVFGLGTVMGMMVMTTAISIPIALSGKKSTRYLTFVSGLASVCFGLFLVYQIGFVDGLFTGHIHWTPQ